MEFTKRVLEVGGPILVVAVGACLFQSLPEGVLEFLTAWTLISVSISKPPAMAGKDLMKRREKTRYPEKISVNCRPKTLASNQLNSLLPSTCPARYAASSVCWRMPTTMSSLDSRPLFEAGVTYASQHGIPMVTADTGSYYFLTLHGGGNAHVQLNGISKVTVNLQYSDLYFAQSNIIGISATDCTNLTLENFTADYLQLPFTQLTVTGVNTTAYTVGSVSAAKTNTLTYTTAVPTFGATTATNTSGFSYAPRQIQLGVRAQF